MGLLFGYLEDVSITAPFVTTEDSKPIYENSAERLNSKKDRSHSLEARGSLKEPESDSPRQKTGKKRGKTRGKGRKLQYLDGSRWVPAVYHHTIRDFLIQQASQNGEYTYPRERGPGHDDVTSFLESQKDWGPERDKNWADILYVFQKGQNHQDPTYTLKIWKFHGKIVISAYDDRPMRLFKDVPDTLSSALHGRDMEAMKRIDPRIQQRDFMARMPLRHTTQAGTRRPLQSASSIGMRMTRFRQQQGLLSWIGRDGSQTIRNALWERLPPENKLANSIRGLEPPSIAEQQDIKKGNAGKFLNRAGRRALTSEERARRKEIVERRLKHRRERELRKAGVRVEDETIEGKRPADDLGVDGLAQPDAEKREQYARQGIPLYDGTANWRATSNLGIDGLAESDAEQREHRPRRGGPNNGTGEPYEERARKQNELKLRLREPQGLSPGDGIPDDGTRVGRPVNSLNADGLAEPDPEQSGYNTRPDRPDNRFRQRGISGDSLSGRRPGTAEQSQDQTGLRRPNNRLMQSPPPNNNSPKPGQDTHQPEQDYNQVGNPSEGGNDTDYSGIIFGSDLPAPPRDFDLEAFLNDFQSHHANLPTVPSPPQGWDLEKLFEGIRPETFDNGGSPSSQKNNQPSPDGDWNFDYTLPGSQVELADQRSSTLNNDNYPSPPDYNFNYEFDGESEQPYYLQPPRRF